MNANIRIFISSTFQDMHAERDYLIKKIFPEIIYEAAKRFVTVVPLDLRWGITDEEARSGKVIDICLSEIDNSRPYFIGIIGDRYGWCPKPEEINLSAVEKRFPGIKRYVESELSITEIEMQYAVLDTGLESNALFLLKQTASLGEDEKLSELKECIKQKCPRDWHNYGSVEELGKIVRENFMNFLNANFPQGSCSDHEKLRMTMQNIVEEKSINYIHTNSHVLRQLLDHVNSNEPSVELLIGKQGSGKSAFTTRFIRSVQQEKRCECIYYLHEENVSDKTMMYISRYFNELLNTDSNDAGSHRDRPIVIVVDGIDRLPDFTETDLYKLLDLFNPYHLVLTLNSDSGYIRFIEEYPDKSHCNRLLLEELSPNEKQKIIEGFLKKHRKKLSQAQCAKLIEGHTSRLTSFFTILNCLVSFGHFDNLEHYIGELARMDDQEVSAHVLNQIREIFGNEIIDKVFALLMASKHGMKEHELCEILGFRQLDWSSIYSVSVNFLDRQSGLLMLKADYKPMVQITSTSEHLDAATHALIHYFRTVDSDRSNEELAYQYLKIKDYDSLYNLMVCYKNFKSLYLHDEHELAAYWRALITHDSKKYSLSVYSDLSYLLQVNKPLRVEHKIMGDFILFHFNEAQLAIEHYKHNEWNENRLGVATSVVMENNALLSPKFWYCISLTEKDAEEKMKALNRAIQTEPVRVGLKEDLKYIFLAYLQKAHLCLKAYDVIEASKAVDQASLVRTAWLANDPLMKGMECRIASCVLHLVSLPEKAISEAKQAVAYSSSSSSESIRSHANLLTLLIRSRVDNPSFEKQAYVAAQTLKTEAKRYFGQSSSDYAKVLIELGKSYTVLSGYAAACDCLKQAKEIYEQKSMPGPANLNEKDFEPFHIDYTSLCSALGCLYAYPDTDIMDIAAAYYWLKECRHPYNETYLRVTELRDKQLEEFEAGTLCRDEMYTCRLIFPSDNTQVEEKWALEQMHKKDVSFSRFCQAYLYAQNMAEIYPIEFPASDLCEWIKREGANRVLHQIKMAVIRCWIHLKKEYPELLSNAHLTNDNDILYAAETTQIKKLQIFLISLLEVVIEMEGFELVNRELYLKHRKELMENGIAKWRKRIEENH